MKGKTMNHNTDDTTQNLYDEDMTADKQTYFLALEVEPMEIGQAYEQLPMYCTIMPRFHTALNVDELVAALEAVFAKFGPITLAAGEHLAFGPQKQLVTLVEPNRDIVALHQALFDELNKMNVQYAELEWVSGGYIPHVTDKQGERFQTKAPGVSKNYYLINIEHPFKGNNRTVLYEFHM